VVIVDKVIEKEKNYREIFIKHLLKFISFLFAITLWFYVLNSEPLEQENEMAISFVTPPGLVVGNKANKIVRVKLRGARAFMRNLSNQKNQVIIDLRSRQYRKKKQFDVLINPSDIPAPFGVDILEVVPSRISVKLEREIKKKLNLKAVFNGEVASELKLIKYELKPAELLLSGPVEVMRGISRLKTLPIEVSKLQGEGSIKVNLEELDERVNVEKGKVVEFHYSIKPRKANLSLELVKVRFLSSHQNISPEQRLVRLDVLAPEGKKLSNSDVEVIADVPESQLGNAGRQVKVRLKATLPDGVHLLQIEPPYINVMINK
jgi:YbbR domain-containing protein